MEQTGALSAINFSVNWVVMRNLGAMYLAKYEGPGVRISHSSSNTQCITVYLLQIWWSLAIFNLCGCLQGKCTALSVPIHHLGQGDANRHPTDSCPGAVQFASRSLAWKLFCTSLSTQLSIWERKHKKSCIWGIIYLLYFMGKSRIWTLALGSETPLSVYIMGLSMLVRILKLGTFVT